MSRQQRLIQLPLIGTILLCLLVAVYLFAGKRSLKKKSDPSSTVAKHAVDTHSDDALKYWTADKMHATRGTNMPNVDTLAPEKQHPRRPPV